MRDIARLIPRLVVGGLMAGHGAQKLFGWFGGPGLQGAGGWLESLGLRPGQRWAVAAGGSEFGGGVLTALGFLHPLGPIGILASMLMAAVKAHGGKPIWVTEGGAELPVTNMAIAAALALVAPGRISLDCAFGIRLPGWMIALAVAAAAAGVGAGLKAEPSPPEPASTNGRQPVTV
jgi:putative oxidoreductase